MTCTQRYAIALLMSVCFSCPCAAIGTEPPVELRPWLEPQNWVRDRAEPVLSLGAAGAFDDQHLFAPCVREAGEEFLLWYCGSRGTVEQRVFELGLARSRDGRQFAKVGAQSTYQFGDGKHSILTPTILRDGDRWRMWFAATDFVDGKGLHTLHEATSDDGLHWSAPSPALLSNVYAPTILKTGRTYRMWFTRVGQNPWVICHATSLDGRQWRVSPEPVLTLDQPWELSRLFYPTVVHQDGVYLMWYGSYWQDAKPAQKTALGFAVSLDGLRWYKHPENPVFRPEPERAWESHYVTSQSVLRLADGSWRMWYASRTKPPFRHKYFAMGTASWAGPRADATPEFAAIDPEAGRSKIVASQEALRERLRAERGIPGQRVPLDAEARGQIAVDDIVIEKWVIRSEPGSKIPLVLYRPATATGRLPGIVLTYGHGGSKSTWEHQYAGQLYAKMGIACLAMDPLGEEERHADGRMGTRAHDDAGADAQAAAAGRLIMGKLCFDAMRGLDFLEQRQDVDPQRLGVAGYSLGGATGTWVTMLDTRVRCALVVGWAFDDITLRTKLCTRVPNVRLRERATWSDFVSLAAPRCALLVMNGDADTVIDLDEDHAAWDGTRRAVASGGKVFAALSAPVAPETWFRAGGGHRPYFIEPAALLWIHDHLGTPRATHDQVAGLATQPAGEWLDTWNVPLEKLYGTELHWRGTQLPDVGVRYLAPRELAVLQPGEAGSADFTLAGWLEAIRRK
ncbi:MAG: acetylxylan esterase [Pirellulaceae bacterium]